MKHLIHKLTFAVLCLVAVFATQTAMAQKARNISGQVFDNEGKPMIGATVVVMGTSTGTTTDVNGKFTIKAKQDDQLSFSFLGYLEVIERVGTRTQLNIVLKPENVSINEVVVIGYGQQQKSDITGSVTSINMDELSDMPVLSADEALQGRVAGVDIVTADGEPGANSSIRVRGSRSINASNEPLIVVDGVMDAVANFSDINPADIKNVTVLKDASSTAIYGSRGANGVILVTTHGGENNKFSITFNAKVGISEIPRKLDVMNATEFAAYRNDVAYMGQSNYWLPDKGYYNRSSSSYTYKNPDAWGEGTNWVDVLTQTGIRQSYFLSLSGGGKHSKAYFSVAYDDEVGVVINSGMQRLTTRLKFDQQLFKWMKVGINLSYTYRDQNRAKVKISGTSAAAAIATNPMQDMYSTWNLLGDNGVNGGTVYNNPYFLATNTTNDRVTRTLNMAPYIELTLYKGLKLLSRFSYTTADTDSFTYSPSYMPLATKRRTGGTASRSNTDDTRLLSETTLTYNRTFKKSHKFSVMAGFTAQNIKNDYEYMHGVGYLDDNVTFYNMGSVPDRRNLTGSSSFKETQRLSVLGRATYSYKGRYHATLTMRYDGSSAFAKGHKWGFFPAAAFKWSMHNERFLKSVDWISDLSVRLSAGRSGNDAVANYVSQMSLSNSVSGWLFNEVQDVSYYPTRLDNPNLTWEKTDSYNLGIDFAVLNNRISMSFETYLAYTTDLLMNVNNPSHSGFNKRYMNTGNTRNTGVEFTITSRNISRPKFQWTTSLTISHNKQIVTDLGSDMPYIATYSTGGKMAYGYVKGYPANSLWGFQFAGVWHNADEIAENELTKAYGTYEKKPGVPKYVDVNHDGLLSDADLVYMGSSDPLINGGLNNTFRIIKNLSIGLYFTYSLGGKIYNLSEIGMGSGTTTRNQYRYMINAWHPVRNPWSDIPAARKGADSYPSQRILHDASYLRLQNVSVSYTFDLKKVTRHLRDITLSANVQNAFLWTGYNGYDPDVSTSGSIRRFDNGAYPRARIYTVSLKIRY